MFRGSENLGKFADFLIFTVFAHGEFYGVGLNILSVSVNFLISMALLYVYMLTTYFEANF